MGYPRYRLRSCATCAGEFRSVAGTYCSLACRPADVAARARRSATAEARAAALAARVARAAEIKAMRLADDADRQRTCPQCGVIFYAHYRGKRFCTTRCKSVFHSTAHGPLTLECVVCHAAFEDIHPNARYCSNRCRRKVARKALGELARRRAQKKVRAMRPRIIARWGMVCYLCERPITVGPKETTNPGALTLDHVVPITAGGRDSEDNLRPAHRACNEDKGERLPAWWELRQAHIA